MQKILENDPLRRTKENLMLLLESARLKAENQKHFQIISITLEVDFLDPLGVLAKIYGPGEDVFCMHKGDEESSFIALGNLIDCLFDGENRWNEMRAFGEDILSHTLAVGDTSNSLGGLRLCSLNAFEDNFSGDLNFKTSKMWLPKWQVCKIKGSYFATANCKIDVDVNIQELCDKLWSTYETFTQFKYGDPAIEQLNNGHSSITRTTFGGDDYYEKAFEKALAYIRKDDLKKIVLSKLVLLESEKPFDVLNTFYRMTAAYPNCYNFLYTSSKCERILIGASPEPLVRMENGKIYTEAIAGTSKRGKNIKEDVEIQQALLESEKEFEEHQYVSDFIVDRLQGIGIQNLQIAKRKIKIFGHLQHLCTEIKGECMKDMNILQIVKTLHPTPAVGGYPVKDIVKIINQLEGINRVLYGGILGWYNGNGDGHMIVGLRSASIVGNKAEIQAGSGIVIGSNCKNESIEIDNKLDVILNCLR